MDQADIARLLQAHLKRVGCDPGNSDGKWDDASRKALELFNKNAQTKFDVKLASLDALDAVRGKTDRVCPLVCAKGQKAEGDRCVQVGLQCRLLPEFQRRLREAARAGAEAEDGNARGARSAARRAARASQWRREVFHLQRKDLLRVIRGLAAVTRSSFYR
jgi:hypothetical protein